jgi:hypothetical protein
MKKIIISIFALSLPLLITCCSEKESGAKLSNTEGSILLDLSKFGKQFSIYVPDTTTSKLEIVEQSWGALDLKVGTEFQLSIMEDPGDMEFKKSDIKANDVNVFKSFVIDEPLTVIWESAITKPEYHFYSIQKIGADTFVFEDIVSADGSSKSKIAIERMVTSVKKIIAKEKLDS